MKKLAIVFFFLCPILLLALTGFSLLTYTRLTDEEPIAEVYFDKVGDKEYMAFLSEKSNKNPATYKIYGDQWRIDAYFLKLRPWVNILGFDARYNLERFEGRYEKVRDQNNLPRLSHDLGESSLFQIPELFLKYNFLIDTEYGSSAYKEIDVGNIYTVYRTQSGVIIREAKRINK